MVLKKTCCLEPVTKTTIGKETTMYEHDIRALGAINGILAFTSKKFEVTSGDTRAILATVGGIPHSFLFHSDAAEALWNAADKEENPDIRATLFYAFFKYLERTDEQLGLGFADECGEEGSSIDFRVRSVSECLQLVPGVEDLQRQAMASARRESAPVDGDRGLS
jgi:hypothetical protein